MSEKFWVLESPRVRLAKWDTGNVWKKRDSPISELDSGRDEYTGFGGPSNRLLDLRVVLKSREVQDFVWTIPDCLIRSRVLDMFHEQNFTGFQVRHVRARLDTSLKSGDSADEAVPGAHVQGLWELVVTGWGGVATPESGVTRIPNTNIWQGCPDWSKIVDIDAWDGSDFFIVWPFGFVRLVSDRVATFIKEQKLAGVKLVSPEACTRWYKQSKLNQATPMRLRDHLPDERAREIGEPLGIY